MRKILRQYVNDFHVGTICSEWPFLRVVRALRKKYPNASSWEVRAENENSVTIKHEPMPIPEVVSTVCSCAQCQGYRR